MSIKLVLKKLSEDTLRQKIVIPLLFALGCETVRDNCSPRENGKDIIYSKKHFLKQSIYGAALLKVTNISKPDLYNTLQRQISEAIVPFISYDEPNQKIR